MGADQILIEPMDNWAGLNEPNDNPKFWVNVCYRQYYGIEVLAAEPAVDSVSSGAADLHRTR